MASSDFAADAHLICAYRYWRLRFLDQSISVSPLDSTWSATTMPLWRASTPPRAGSPRWESAGATSCCRSSTSRSTRCRPGGQAACRVGRRSRAAPPRPVSGQYRFSRVGRRSGRTRTSARAIRGSPSPVDSVCRVNSWHLADQGGGIGPGEPLPRNDWWPFPEHGTSGTAVSRRLKRSPSRTRRASRASSRRAPQQVEAVDRVSRTGGRGPTRGRGRGSRRRRRGCQAARRCLPSSCWRRG